MTNATITEYEQIVDSAYVRTLPTEDLVTMITGTDDAQWVELIEGELRFRGYYGTVQADDEYDPSSDIGCECEQDWNCGLHGGNTRPTWIESRYQGMDEDERIEEMNAVAYGYYTEDYR